MGICFTLIHACFSAPLPCIPTMEPAQRASTHVSLVILRLICVWLVLVVYICWIIPAWVLVLLLATILLALNVLLALRIVWLANQPFLVQFVLMASFSWMEHATQNAPVTIPSLLISNAPAVMPSVLHAVIQPIIAPNAPCITSNIAIPVLMLVRSPTTQIW